MTQPTPPARSLTTRAAVPEESEQVIEMCLAAFADEAVTTWVLPDPSVRDRAMQEMFRHSLGATIEAGHLILAIDPDGAPIAASTWLPAPGTPRPTITPVVPPATTRGACVCARWRRRLRLGNRASPTCIWRRWRCCRRTGGKVLEAHWSGRYSPALTVWICPSISRPPRPAVVRSTSGTGSGTRESRSTCPRTARRCSRCGAGGERPRTGSAGRHGRARAPETALTGDQRLRWPRTPDQRLRRDGAGLITRR